VTGVEMISFADLVRHAHQGDVGLGQRHREQVGEADLQGPGDHAVDPQRPGLRRYLGQHQVGVDPVEARVRGEERGQPRDPQAGAGGDGRGADGRRGQPHPGPGRGDAEPPEQRVTQAPGRGGQPRRGRPRDQQAAPIRASRGIHRAPGLRGYTRLAVRGTEPGQVRPHGPREHGQRRCRDGHPGQRGHHIGAASTGQADRRGGADGGEHGEPGQPVGQAADGQDADQRGEGVQQHHDPGDQGLLVVRAEMRDREVLHRDRSQVDRGLADRGHRGTGRAGRRRCQLGHAQCHAGSQRPGAGPPRAVPSPCLHHAPHSGLPGDPDWWLTPSVTRPC